MAIVDLNSYKVLSQRSFGSHIIIDSATFHPTLPYITVIYKLPDSEVVIEVIDAGASDLAMVSYKNLLQTYFKGVFIENGRPPSSALSFASHKVFMRLCFALFFLSLFMIFFCMLLRDV